MNFDLSQNIILENEFVKLSPIATEDYSNLFDVATADKDLLKYSPNQVYSPELLQKFIDNAIDGYKNGTKYTFIIYDKIKQKFAGSSSFMNISNLDSRLEIGGTWYGKEFQRTGVNRNCKFLLLTYAFENLEALRVEFKIDERNAASRKGVERIGAQYEGTLRSHTLLPDGFRRNTTCYSILKDEWMETKSNFPLY